MRYVIIGNSAAAVGTIEGIRSIDKEGEITVISKEKHHTYSRPLISYYLNGNTDIERMKYRNNNFYKENGVKFLAENEVVKIDKKEKLVVLSNNEEIRYDKLMMATGSTPFVPPFKGLDKVEKFFTFSSLDDALSLEKELRKDKKILIIGAGLIGLKCAEGIYDKVKSITIADLSHKVLSSILDDKGSEIIKDYLIKKGLNFKMQSEVDCFEKSKAIFKDGEEIEFDILVIAIGVRCNISLAKEADIETNRGVLVNEKLHTSEEDIFSSGDCSEGYDSITETKRVLALLPNAYMQGEVAGKNMAGADEKFLTGMAMNAIGFFGLHIVTAGIYEGESIVKQNERTYKRLFYKDNRLKGFIIIGDCGRAGIYTSIIREKISLTDTDFPLLTESPQLIALNNNILRKKLGENL